MAATKAVTVRASDLLPFLLCFGQSYLTRQPDMGRNLCHTDARKRGEHEGIVDM